MTDQMQGNSGGLGDPSRQFPGVNQPFPSLTEERVNGVVRLLEPRFKVIEGKFGQVTPILEKQAQAVARNIEQQDRSGIVRILNNLYDLWNVARSVLDSQRLGALMTTYQDPLIECIKKGNPSPMLKVLEMEIPLFIKTPAGTLWLQKFIDAFLGVRPEMLQSLQERGKSNGN